MKPAIAFAITCLAVPAPFHGFAQQNREPEVFTLKFTKEIAPLLNRESGAERPKDWPDWIKGIGHSNGALTDDGAWLGGVADFQKETALSLFVDNKVLTSDLALTLSFSDKEACDFAVQIFDDKNRVVAVDLFGNVAENSIHVGTDTYIIPMSRYPSAARIAIRQLNGRLLLYGLVAFPVLSELPADPKAELTMLQMLGGELSKESRLYRALHELVPGTGAGASSEKVIGSMRAEILKDFQRTQSALAERLVGTEWLLRDVYRQRLARFLPDGAMLQQHVQEGAAARWNDDLPKMGRRYRVLDATTVQFGIGGWLARFNDNFTEMTYENAAGKSWAGRLIGKFTPDSEPQKIGGIKDYSRAKGAMSEEAFAQSIVGTTWRASEYKAGDFQAGHLLRFGAGGVLEHLDEDKQWTPYMRYRVTGAHSIKTEGKYYYTLSFDAGCLNFSGACSSGRDTVVARRVGPDGK